MLRTTLRQSRSLASLRVAASPAPALPLGARGLASSALFQEVSWAKATVPAIKKELAQRGLSTAGKKAALLSRLQSAEASFPSARSASSSPPKAPVPTDTKETNTDTVTAPATAEISSPATAEVPAKDDGAQSKTSAPGLPNNPFDGAKKTLDVKMPVGKEDEGVATAIPTILGSGSTYPPSEPKPDEPESHPKLMTAASAATHIAPPRSHINELSDSHSIDVAEGAKDADDVATGNRPLNEEERSGLIVAAAILGGGYLLSLGLDKTQPKVAKAVHDAEDKVEAKLEKGKKVVSKKLEGAKDKAEEVKDKAEDLLEDGKKKAKGIKGEVEDKVEEGKKKAAELKDKAEDKAAKAKGEVEDKVDEGKKKAEELVEDGKKKAENAKEAIKEKTK